MQAHAIFFRYENSIDFVLQDASFSVEPGEHIAMVGPNGSGKSTLLRILAGELRPQQGSVHLDDQHVLYLPQVIDHAAQVNVKQWLHGQLGLTAIERELQSLEHAGLEDDERLKKWGVARQRLETLGGDHFETNLEKAFAEIPQIDFEVTQSIHTLSGGQVQRLKLLLIALARHDTVLLDEPTNDLDREGIDWLESWIRNFAGGIVIVSHDRHLLDRVINCIAAIEPRTRKVLKARCTYSEFIDLLKAGHGRLAEDKQRQQRVVKDLKRRIVETRSRVDRSPGKAGRADNDKMARDFRAARASVHAGAKLRRLEKELSRIVEIELPKEYEMRFDYEVEPIPSPIAISFRNLRVDLGGRTFGPYSGEIHSGARLAITGPNGAGKTTLLRMLLKEITAEGEVSLARDAGVFFLPQDRWVESGRSLWEVVSVQTQTPEGEAKSRLTQFGLTHDFWNREIASLSPGERTRLLTCLINLQKPNFIILDEPTNHLDVEAVEALERGLARFSGTLAIVSHDEVFLDHVGISSFWRIYPDGLKVIS